MIWHVSNSAQYVLRITDQLVPVLVFLAGQKKKRKKKKSYFALHLHSLYVLHINNLNSGFTENMKLY